MLFKTSIFTRNEFVKNIFTLFKGNIVAQLITLISIPILTRLYTPSEFGILALFISLVNVLAVFATGRFDMAIVLPKRNGNAFHMLVAVFALAVFVSLLCLFVIIIFHNSISGYFDSSVYKKIIWILPLCVFLTATQKTMTYWFTRSREFSIQASNRIIQNASQTGVRLIRSIFTNGHWGLFSGYLVGLLFSWYAFLIQVCRRDYWKLQHISFKTSKKMLREYNNFPIYLMPMGVLNTISVNLLIFALSIVTTSTILGHYERAWRVINFPLSLISASFSNVFFEKMSKKGSSKIYLYSYFGNLGIALLILFPVGFWGEEIFSFILGKDWLLAGRIARVMLPLTIFSFATQSISTTFSVINKNQLLLVWQIIYLIISIGWIFFARKFDIYILLSIFSILGAVLYILLAIIGYNKLIKFNVSNSPNIRSKGEVVC